MRPRNCPFLRRLVGRAELLLWTRRPAVDGGSRGGGSLTVSMPWDDDDDWVGEPPEGRYTRDRAKPEFWRQPWPWAGAGFALLLVIVVVVLVVR
jgi:hypothetical protein